MNCAIIGAGQLGSRHLQGLLTFSKEKLHVYVVDPAQDSLNMAQQRGSEVSHEHQITFIKDISALPDVMDFVVVATNSKVRLQVLRALSQQSKIKYLILEKVLFPEISQYEYALEIIGKHQIQCWVNHPRRMYDDYRKLKTRFSKEKTYAMQVTGAAWGLACNGLHFIDFFEFLTDSPLTNLETNLLNKQPIASKRNGYLEFEGEIHGSLGNKHSFSIQSIPGEQLLAPSISIMTDDLRLFIQESGTPAIYTYSSKNNFAPEIDAFGVAYQSQLTGKLLNQLVTTGDCDLPTLAHASSTHQIFIQALLKHWNDHNQSKESYLPIT